MNAYIARGHKVSARHAGDSYFDVGTIQGYRRAMALLGPRPELAPAALTHVP